MTALDLDELIASGQVEADPDALKHARLTVLTRAANVPRLLKSEDGG